MAAVRINQLALRYLLLQVREPHDAMRDQEVRCFARALDCEPAQIQVLDLIRHAPSRGDLDGVDIVLLGGSGDYSVVTGGAWLHRALDAVAGLHEIKKPTFASCWGFQAMARALGGTVVTDLERAELGTFEVHLTDLGKHDPVLGSLESPFLAHEGHQDIVTALPAEAELLATTNGGIYQAFRLLDAPIYCTQFHPELDRHAYLERIRQYPEYLENLLGISIELFASRCQETPVANQILRRFVQFVVEG